MRQLPTSVTATDRTGSHPHDMRRMLRLLQAASFAGLAYAAVQLTAQDAPGDHWQMCVYAAWFVIAIASAETMLNWLAAGVWTLVTATGLLLLVDVLSGSVVGWTMSAIIALLLWQYVRPQWQHFT